MSIFTLQGNLKVPNDGHIGSDGDEDAITIDSSGNIGIGTDDPKGKLHIFEETGTALTANTGTLILEHNDENAEGKSSILFKSNVNAGSDYGFIKYSDNGAANGSNSENSLLEIGVKNDNGDNDNNDELKFSVPGGFMYMRADGNVGIGTDQPNIQLALGDTDTGFQQQGDGELAVYTNDVERMRIDLNGNVGIGTTNPQQKLDISGGYLGVRSANEATNSVIYIGAPFNQETNVAYKGAIYFEAETNYSTGKLHICNRDVENDNDNGNNISADVGDARISILPNGNVGIGVTDPEEKLDVNGNIHIRGESGATAFSLLNDSDGLLRFRQNGGVTLASAYTVGGTVEDVMVISAAGRVGIGTNIFDDNDRFKVGGGRLSIVYGGTDENGNESHAVFFSAETNIVNQTGVFRFKWARSSNKDYNVEVIMYNDNNPEEDKKEQVVGFFENNNNEGSFDFTGQHRSIMNTNYADNVVGLIASATGKLINLDNETRATVNESLPYCTLANSDNDKKVYGVISQKEDGGAQRGYGSGFVATMNKANDNEQRMYINAVGEGGIWVCNKNGVIENGDYVTSSSVVGYGMKQLLNEGLLTNYTVAKLTQDCEFSLTRVVKQKLKVIVDTDAEGNTTSSIDYDENGDVQYEDDLDSEGNQQMVYPLDTRFLQEDGTLLVDEADYNTRLANGESVYIACFVGCTYHCG